MKKGACEDFDLSTYSSGYDFIKSTYTCSIGCLWTYSKYGLDVKAVVKPLTLPLRLGTTVVQLGPTKRFPSSSCL